MQKHIAILGGGLSGLVTAEKLLEAGHKVTIFEKEAVLGGLAGSFKKKGKWIPNTYHHFFGNEYLKLSLIKKYGLDNDIFWNDAHMAFWFNKKPYRLTKSYDILFFKPASIISRLRMVRLGIISALRKDWKKYSHMDAETWVEKIAGKELSKKLFNPLADIKFGELNSVSAAWFGERLHEAAVNKEKYGYLHTGLHELIVRMENSIKKKGGKIYVNTTIEKIDGNRIFVKIGQSTRLFKADKIVSSLAPPLLAKLAKLKKEEKFLLENINYQSLTCMVCSSKYKLSKYYWNIFIKPKLSFGGMFHHTALYPKGGTNGEYLYYFFTYLKPNNPLFKKTEDEIKEVYIKDIKKLCPEFETTWYKMFKIKYSSPIYKIGYDNLPIKFNDKLYLTGVYRMYPSTRTMDSAAKSGLQTANFLIKEIENEKN